MLRGFLLGLGLIASARAEALGAGPDEPCEQQLLGTSAAERTLCFFNEAQRSGAWDAARARLERLRADHPDLHWASLAQAHLERGLDPQRAEALYRSAAEGFGRSGGLEGELLARINLRQMLRAQRKTQAARAELERALELARSSQAPHVVARGLALEAADRLERGDDLGRAWRLVKRAEGLAFPDGPRGLQRVVLETLASAESRLGRIDEALATYERLGALARQTREGTAEAQALFARANLALRRLQRLPLLGEREQVLALGRAALMASERVRSENATMMSLRLIADVLPYDPSNQLEALGHLRRCLELARRAKRKERELACRLMLAERRAQDAPAAATRMARASLQMALGLDSPLHVLMAWRTYLNVAEQTGSREQLLALERRALDALEGVHGLQGDARSRAELADEWSVLYERLAGHLLEAGQAGERAAIEEAFAVMERWRARGLAEELLTQASARVTADDRAALQTERASIFRRLSDVQRRLLEPGRTAPSQADDLGERLDLELQEQELRAQLRARRSSHELAPATTLSELERVLAPDEALLSFRSGLGRGYDGGHLGGAWLLVSTSAGTRVYALPGREQLEPFLPVLSRLVARRDGSETTLAVTLYERLLAPALSELSPDVRRLVIVADGPLHGLPFSVLREPTSKAPLIERYELTLASSATLWRHWRIASAERPADGVLALADPAVTRTLAAGTDALRTASQLGPLPGARREARAAVSQASGTRLLLEGAAASESALQRLDWRPFGVLHVAAHVVVDQEQPDRTAVILAPGGPEHDGLLQAREIAELPLRGRLVVLSACQGATGLVVGGEGALSLARAFFQAGASVVVAGQWPLRDDETRWLMERFYRRLGEGASVAAALRDAQREAAREGLPAAAWSGIVAFGDGSLRPFAGRLDQPTTPNGAWALGLVVAGVLLSALGARLIRGRVAGASGRDRPRK